MRLFGAPPPLILFGGKSLVALVGKTRMRLHREDEIACPICPRFPGQMEIGTHGRRGTDNLQGIGFAILNLRPCESHGLFCKLPSAR